MRLRMPLSTSVSFLLPLMPSPFLLGCMTLTPPQCSAPTPRLQATHATKPALTIQGRMWHLGSPSRAMWLRFHKSQGSYRGCSIGDPKKHIHRHGASQHSGLLPLDPSQPGVPHWCTSSWPRGNTQGGSGAGKEKARSEPDTSSPRWGALSQPEAVRQLIPSQ